MKNTKTLSDEQKFIMEARYQKWSPRFWDNAAFVFDEISSIIVFFLALYRLIGTVKNLRQKNACVKEIIMFCIMIFNFIFFGFICIGIHFFNLVRV
ncbi:MAG: hypothetical protein J5817_04375 [Treponema sp.]|nr:hypothetical protein [Treponema sp.]